LHLFAFTSTPGPKETTSKETNTNYFCG